MSQDQAEREAAGLLPCDIHVGDEHFPHHDTCAAYYRPAVAAKLRSLYAEIERLEKLNGDYASIISEVTEERDQWKVPAEIAKKLANQLQDDNAQLRAQLAEAEEQRDEAHTAGLREAMEICRAYCQEDCINSRDEYRCLSCVDASLIEDAIDAIEAKAR